MIHLPASRADYPARKRIARHRKYGLFPVAHQTIPADDGGMNLSDISRFLLVVPVLALTACEDKKAAQSKATVAAATPAAFEPGPAPNRARRNEALRTVEAMKIADVDFLLRTATGENEILKEISERGFLAQVSTAEANALAERGASARLIALVQDRRYLLTPEELAEHNARGQRRAQNAHTPQRGDFKQRMKDFEQRQQKLHAEKAS